MMEIVCKDFVLYVLLNLCPTFQRSTEATYPASPASPGTPAGCAHSSPDKQSQ